MSRPPAIVAAGPLADPGPDILRPFGPLAVAESDDRETLVGLLGEAKALIARGATVVDAALIEAAPALMAIGRTGVGVDLVDLEAATARGIPVITTPGCNDAAVAEGTIAMLCALAKRLPQLDEAVRSSNWAERDRLLPADLAGSVLAVVGFGTIGRRVAAMAQALGMEILACDPHVPEGELISLGAKPVSIGEAFEQADHVSLHVPLDDGTRGLVDADLLERARPNLRLVNVSRGAVAPLDVLCAGLESGALGGVAVDVFETEPPDTGHPIFEQDGFICSPHVMALTPGASSAVARAVSEGIVAALEGRRPEHVANPELYAA